MALPAADVTVALATLRSRWGAAAPRRGLEGDLRPDEAETDGALAIAPLPADPSDRAPIGVPAARPDGPDRDVVSTGFPALDAILGPGGIPLAATVALDSAGSSGAATLALRLVAEGGASFPSGHASDSASFFLVLAIVVAAVVLVPLVVAVSPVLVAPSDVEAPLPDVEVLVECTPDNGVHVDEHLRAADDVWAVGDIAAYQSVVHGRRLRIEHWDVALNQGGYVGRTWAGKETEPYTTVPYFFSDIGDWTWFEYVGPGSGRVDIRGSMADDDFVAYYLDGDDTVTACLGVNRSDDVNDAKELIASHRGAPVT